MAKTVAKQIPEHFVAANGGICLYANEQAADSATAALPSEIQIITADDYAARELHVKEQHLHEMVKNHLASGVDPAVDREHESWLSKDAAQPAQGWVKSLRVGAAADGKPALFGAIEWTDLGQNTVTQKHFRYVSAGFSLASKDRRSNKPIGAFLDHVALVKHPFVQGMTPLSFSYNTASAENTEPQMNQMTEAKQLLGLSADAEDTALVSALSTFKAKAEEGRVSLAAVTEERNALKSENDLLKKAGVVAAVEAAIAAFKLTPAERDEQIELATKQPELFKSLLAKRVASKPGDTGLTVDSAKPRELGIKKTKEERAALADKEVRAYALANKIEYAEAFSAVAQAKPELFDESEGE